MSKCILVIGKTCSGKNYTMDRIIHDYGDKVHKVLQHTDRPMRNGEENGKDYIFHSYFPIEKFAPGSCESCLCHEDTTPISHLLHIRESYEKRTFRTNHYSWNYWSDFSEFSKDKANIVAGDKHMIRPYTEHFSDVHILYTISSDGDRLQRYLNRVDGTMYLYDEIMRRNRRDDADHESLFNVSLNPEKTPISFIVGDIDPSEYIPDILRQNIGRPLSHVYYKDENNKMRQIHFCNFSIEYDRNDNIITIGKGKSITIDLYTLKVTNKE